MDTVYHQSLQSLTPERLDFVRQDEQWPAIRTSQNKLAVPDEKPRTKKDWHSQRTRFIIQTYLGMHEGDDTDKEALLNNMFDDGKYSWVKDTARVIRAVQRAIPANTRAKAFIALSHLCDLRVCAPLRARVRSSSTAPRAEERTKAAEERSFAVQPRRRRLRNFSTEDKGT